MHKESFDFEWWLIDFIYKSLVPSRYLGLEWLNILVWVLDGCNGIFIWAHKSLVGWHGAIRISIPGALSKCRWHQRHGLGLEELGMHRESFNFEWVLIDFIYEYLVSWKYLGLEWLNVLVPDFGWM
jgi:hypothetical protein